MNNKIQKVNELCYGKFISLYDFEYKNKLNENKHWTVATRKDKEAVEDFYLNQNEDKVDAVGICAYHVRYKKLVIIKQFRVPINDYIYEVPAGLVDKGDKDILESVKKKNMMWFMRIIFLRKEFVCGLQKMLEYQLE